MRKKPNNKLIGLFILCGIGMFIATIGMFVSDKIIQDDDHKVVMYFTESIKGLDVGSPVMFQGVTVGKVVKIDVITDLEDLNFSIPVYVVFSRNKIAASQPHENGHKLLEELVKKGLRARLGTQNFLTGQLMIELEFVPEEEKAIYRGRKDSSIPEIPTVLSQFAEISQGIQELPLRETIRKVNEFLEDLNNVIMPDAKRVLDDFGIIPQRTKSLPETINNFNRTLQNISNAAKSFGNFADYLERHPESLLRGKGGY